MFHQIIDLKNYYYISKIQKELEECNKRIKKLSSTLKVRKFFHLSINRDEYLREYRSIILKLHLLLITVCQLEEYEFDSSGLPVINDEQLEAQKELMIKQSATEIQATTLSIIDQISACLISTKSVYFLLLNGGQKE